MDRVYVGIIENKAEGFTTPLGAWESIDRAKLETKACITTTQEWVGKDGLWFLNDDSGRQITIEGFKIQKEDLQ
jgi:hypothetical protein